MAIIKETSVRYIGLSSDTKPTSGVVTYAQFVETDTKLLYLYNGSSWDLFTEKAVTETLTNKTLTTPIISTISNTGTLTLPTSTDTLVGRATTDTLTNKTLTTPVISSINNTGTLTLPTSTDTLVGRATTDTLTNKTLTAPVISTISNTGTLTLPTSTDTIVGKATTDTLTNKTINSNANTFQGIQNNPFYGKKTGGFYPRGSLSNGFGMCVPAQMTSSILVGAGPPTVSGIANDANGIGSVCDTSATVNNLSGWKVVTLTTRQFNPVLLFRFKIVATTAFRFFAGFSSGSSSNPASNSDYLNALSGAGLWVDSAVSANWKIMHNDGSGASTQDDTSTAFDAVVHTLSITALDSGPSFTIALDGATMTNGVISADQPAQTTLIGPIFYIENTAGASKTFNWYKLWIETDL